MEYLLKLNEERMKKYSRRDEKEKKKNQTNLQVIYLIYSHILQSLVTSGVPVGRHEEKHRHAGGTFCMTGEHFGPKSKFNKNRAQIMSKN